MLQVNVKVMATAHALHFFKREEIAAKVYVDEDEWTVRQLFAESPPKPLHEWPCPLDLEQASRSCASHRVEAVGRHLCDRTTGCEHVGKNGSRNK